MKAGRQTRAGTWAPGALALAAAAAVLGPGVPAVAAAAPVAADAAAGEVLFTFDALVYAASSVASPAEFAALRQYLLVHEANPAVDAAYPLRLEMAATVRQWPRPLRARALTFLLANPAAATNYAALVVGLFGPAPGFLAGDGGVAGGPLEQRVFAHRAQLQNLLREAYRDGHLAAAWQRAAPAWQRAQPEPAHVEALSAGVAHYLQVSVPPMHPASRIVGDPLMPPDTGVTSMFADGHFVMLVGPTPGRRERDVLISHELMHPMLHALLQADRPLREALAGSRCIFAGIQLDPGAAVLTQAVYTSWESYLSESLIRAVSHRLGGVPDGGRGFALTHLLAAEMARYERGGVAFDQAVAALLGRLRGAVCAGSPRPLDTRAIDAQARLFSHA